MKGSGNGSGFDLGWQDQEAMQRRLQEISHHFLSDQGGDSGSGERGRPVLNLAISRVGQLQDELLCRLLCASLESLCPGAMLLDPALPLVPNTMLIRRADGTPGLVSFDTQDGMAALVRGLEAERKMRENRALLCRLYPELAAMTPGQTIGLTVVVPDAASAALLQGSPYLRLDCFSYTAITVNGEAGLLLERASDPAATAAGTPCGQAVEPAKVVTKGGDADVEVQGEGADTDAGLSAQEKNFFRLG